MTELLEKFRNRFLKYSDTTNSTSWKKRIKETKSKYPIRYYLLETLPIFISFNWKWWIKDPIYHFNCKYIIKSHHIKIDVDRFMNYHDTSFRNYHWFDSDDQILYGMFQILVDFMEEESYIVDWSSAPEYQQIFDELTELYEWWTKKRPNRDDSYPSSKDFGFDDIFEDNVTRHPGYKAWREAYNKKEERNHEYELEDTEMLIRLIALRRFMWT